jgi:hypothetical protein
MPFHAFSAGTISCAAVLIFLAFSHLLTMHALSLYALFNGAHFAFDLLGFLANFAAFADSFAFSFTSRDAGLWRLFRRTCRLYSWP